MHEFLDRSAFQARYVKPFAAVTHHYDPDRGFIVWRQGTGANVELLHIRTFTRGKGFGRGLVYHMLDVLSQEPPYHSVFGFTRADNLGAKQFYGALGFSLQELNGLYEDGKATLFWAAYQQLLKKRDAYEDRLRCAPRATEV